MSNTNNNLQTQTANALHNAIIEAGGKDRPPMLAPGNYVQWKSRIKRYIDTKPNNELIRYCLQNLPYKFKWTKKIVPVAEGIDNDIYSTVDACPNACAMWKAIQRLKKGKSINVQDLETNLYCEFKKFTSQEVLTSITIRMTKNFINTSRANQDNSPRTSRGTRYDNQRAVNVVGAKEIVGIQVVQQYGIQCYNCKEYGHVARECKKPKWAKDRDDSDDEHEDQDLEAHYLYMEHVDTKITTSSLDMSNNGGEADQDEDEDLAREQIILFIVDSGCSKHMRGKLKLLSNYMEKFLGMVKFRNDQIAPILGYGDVVQGNFTIKRVYYVEAASSQAWLWHRRLSHLNFDTIKLLLKYDIMTGLLKLKFVKDHLCSSCELEKAKYYLSPGLQSQENAPQAAETVTTSNELDLLFSLTFDELLNGTTLVVSKSSAVTAADPPNQPQQQSTTPSTSITLATETALLNIQKTPVTKSQAPTQAPNVTGTENNNQVENQKCIHQAGCLDSCKRTSGGIQFLGGDKLVSWSSKKQVYTSMSSAKAEYVSLSACCAQVLWMRTQLIDYGFHFDKIPTYCDLKAAIVISWKILNHNEEEEVLAFKTSMRNRMCAAVEAIGSFDLILLNGLVIVLDNHHYAPSITKGVVYVSHLVDNGYMHIVLNYGKSVMEYGVFYFNAITHDGIYEIDMQNLYLNVSSIYNVSNKRAKHALDSTYLWHYRLGHINKKHIEKLQPNKNDEFKPNKVKPHSLEIPIRRSRRIPQAPDRYGLYVDAEEHELGDLDETLNYKAALSYPESNKWLDAINAKMQSMKDNQCLVFLLLVDLLGVNGFSRKILTWMAMYTPLKFFW
nr:uncharacterized mitochondrial protein AtMg00810-like [Tanacetum cinerariifolium]